MSLWPYGRVPARIYLPEPSSSSALCKQTWSTHWNGKETRLTAMLPALLIYIFIYSRVLVLELRRYMLSLGMPEI